MSLLAHPQFFWTVSVLASLFQVALIISAFISQGTTPETGFKSWSKKPSVRITVSFLTGFGWGGVLAMRQGLPPHDWIVVAVVSGVAFTLLMAAMMRFLLDG